MASNENTRALGGGGANLRLSRLRVLAVAYACDPYQGSEYGVGWGWVNAIARKHDITVITADFNSQKIERYYSDRCASTARLRFIYVKSRPWHYCPHGLWPKIEGSLAKPLMNLAYQNWLGYAFAVAQKEVSEDQYDLIHLITYVGWRFPGKFYELEIPFVWGPIGGLINTPFRLFPALGIKGALYYGGRNLINALQIRLLPGPKRALQRASAVIAATSEIRQSLMQHFGAPSHVICEVGVPGIGPSGISVRNMSEPLRICWSGLHLPGKALQLLLYAAARLPGTLVYSLEILGEGPSNRRWRRLAKHLGIEKHCHWYGTLPRERALEVMKDCHVLVITSLKDLTSTVAVEAVALGVPIVCLDHCGFGDLMNGNCGIKIPALSLQKIISDLADALCALYADEELRSRLARGAVLRAQEYTWEKKIIELEQCYLQATNIGQRYSDTTPKSDGKQ